MHLLRYRDINGIYLGVLQDGQIIDLQGLSRAKGVVLPNDMLGIIELDRDGLQRIRRLLEGDTSRFAHALDSVEILAPLEPWENVMAIGRNYQAHAEESARVRATDAERPTVFTKARTAVTDPYADISLHQQVTQQVDWEGELAVVLGRQGINIPEAKALDYVYGYTIINDISARDIQYGWGGQFFKGKSLDGFCPIGPWIVTADEIPNPQQLQVRTRINGQTKQDASTADMIFPVARLIAELSLGMTLLPGNVIATGTPEGVGFARNPPEFLQPGDVVETEIVGIGFMRNRMVAGSRG